MTQQKPDVAQPKRDLIPKPAQDAFWAGCATSGFSIVMGVPGEHIWKVFIGGASLVIGLHVKRSIALGLSDSRKKKQKRENVGIPFTTQKGTKYIDMDLEFSIEQGGYILRESYGQALLRKVLRKGSRPVVKPVEPVERPKELNEFVFYSQGLQLRQVHVDLFLKSAWRNRQYGKGLSARRWVRYWSQRELWYKELRPMWYYAMLDLLLSAGDYCQFHLVVEYENGWRSLVNEPHLTMRILKWYEVEKRKS
jgi:hypothetical protein